jgi:hypothetical protein
MHRAPDHSPAAAAAEHAALIVAFDAGDLAGRERDAAARLATACPGCASLLADLALLRVATAALPARPRTRDYRLTDVDAARLRPSAWRSLLSWLAAPRSTVRPLAGGLAALGIAGLLLTATPGFLGGSATSLTTTGAPAVAPGAADGAAGAVAESALPAAVSGNAVPAPSAASSTGPVTQVRPNVVAPVEPLASGAAGTSPALGVAPATPGVAAVPPPSPLAVALPAPTPPSGAGTLTGPAGTPMASAASSGFSANSGAATDSTTKAAPPEAAQGGRSAVLPAPAQPAQQDRSVPILLSLALLAGGIGLLVVNRALRGRA